MGERHGDLPACLCRASFAFTRWAHGRRLPRRCAAGIHGGVSHPDDAGTALPGACPHAHLDQVHRALRGAAAVQHRPEDLPCLAGARRRIQRGQGQPGDHARHRANHARRPVLPDLPHRQQQPDADRKRIRPDPRGEPRRRQPEQEPDPHAHQLHPARTPAAPAVEQYLGGHQGLERHAWAGQPRSLDERPDHDAGQGCDRRGVGAFPLLQPLMERGRPGVPRQHCHLARPHHPARTEDERPREQV
ncbi:MAG: hypothetical protein MZV64_59790 [Ignavibacteriales bacterium]|nr:hypothetical protein [Ignavibacteriales bacterium]